MEQVKRPYTMTRTLTPAEGALLGISVDPQTGDQGIVATQGDGHRMVVGPPGSGKFTSVIAPLLLLADHASVIVFDVKNGEAAKNTAGHRASLGPVMVLDPFGISGQEAGALNPLEMLQPDDPQILEKATQLAEALFIVSKGAADADYFNDLARNALIALLLHVATAPDEPVRTLKRVREIIRLPWLAGDFAEIAASMTFNPIAGGVVRDMGKNILDAIKNKMEKNVGYMQQTLFSNTGFLDYPTMQATTDRTTLDLNQLRQKVGTLYVVLPEEHLETASRWLRMVYLVAMQKLRASDWNVRLHFVLDEFPALGPFPRVQKDMNLVRSQGMHMHVVTQSIVQMKAHYGDSWESFAAAAKFFHVLGANDLTTQDYVSRRLGTEERTRVTTGESRSSSGQQRSKNVAVERVPVKHPHEIGQMAPRDSFVIIEGNKPLALYKFHYFENQYMKDRASRRALPAPPKPTLASALGLNDTPPNPATNKAAPPFTSETSPYSVSVTFTPPSKR